MTDPEQAARIAAAVAASGITYGLVVLEVGRLLEARAASYPVLVDAESLRRQLAELDEPGAIAHLTLVGTPAELDELELEHELRDAWLPPEDEAGTHGDDELVLRRYLVRGSRA